MNLSHIVRRFRALFHKEAFDAEMSEELRTHLEFQMEHYIARGMSPAEARYAALREFGGVEQIKERARDQRSWLWLEHLLQDVRYAFRQFRRNPGFTLIAVLSLALGIGVNTANFSLIDEFFLKPLPVAHPEELVLFQFTPGPHGGAGRSVYSDFAAAQPLPLPVFESFKTETAVLKNVMAIAGLAAANVESDGQTELALGQLVSGNYHQALGVSAIWGRPLTPADDVAGAPPVAVISHRYWQTRFGGDRGILGRSIFVNRTPVTVVGVTPPNFAGTMLNAGSIDFTLPLSLAPGVRQDGPDVGKPSHSWLRVMGRLNPGVTLDQAKAALELTFQAGMREALGPDDPPRLRIERAGRGRTESELKDQRPFMLVVSGIVCLVLLSACANMANLLLARGATRQREIAVRLALGASRGRIVRQLLTESILLALFGAAAGLLAAMWSLDLISATLTIDWRVLGFTTGVAMLTGIGFGLVPALRLTRLDISAAFQGSSRSLHGGRSRLKTALLVLQVAVSFVLLVGAGLFLRTLRNLRTVDSGFNRHHLLLFSVEATSAGYKDKGADVVRLHQEISERIAALPGVHSVAFSAWPLLQNHGGWHRGFSIPGKLKSTGVTVNTVSADFFATLEIPVLFGRGFTLHDDAGAAPVVVVNEAFARTYFPQENPVGHSLRLDGQNREIAGVVRDVKQRNLRETTPPLVFIPFLQENFGTANFIVRTKGDPESIIAAVRKTVAAIDPKLLSSGFRTQEESVENNVLGAERFFTRVSLSLGALALGLACVGLYGLLSYLVSHRTSEIGVRMALGALPGGIVWLVVRESLVLVGVGIALGIAAAAASGRTIAAMLFGLSPIDPVTYAVVALLLIGVAVLACWLPARRAAKVDPMVALRAE
jgi:predicted permease